MRAVRPSVALNAQLLRLGSNYRSAGISRYIANLLSALPAAASELDLHVFTGEPRAAGLLTGVRLHRTRWPTASPFARIAWEQFIWPASLLAGRYTLAHSLAFVSPLLNPYPSIVTVYDLSYILYPEYFRPWNRLYLTWGTKTSCSRARRVIAISESTRRDLVRLFQIPTDKIDVVAPGVEAEFFSHGDTKNTGDGVEEFRASKRLPEHFALHVGTLEPRKNLPQLIRAFMRARACANLPHHLVLVGGRGWKHEAISQTIEEVGAGGVVHLAGYAPREELPFWYGAADAFVYPSQYEGFGMPPLEALASGTPVITSNVSSLPEAVGNAAVLVDPHDEEALAAAIVRVLTDKALRQDLAARGRSYARGFTWSRAAQQTAGVYRKALHSDPGLAGEAD